MKVRLFMIAVALTVLLTAIANRYVVLDFLVGGYPFGPEYELSCVFINWQPHHEMHRGQAVTVLYGDGYILRLDPAVSEMYGGIDGIYRDCTYTFLVKGNYVRMVGFDGFEFETFPVILEARLED